MGLVKPQGQELGSQLRCCQSGATPLKSMELEWTFAATGEHGPSLVDGVGGVTSFLGSGVLPDGLVHFEQCLVLPE